jgi:hypothetical protein
MLEPNFKLFYKILRQSIAVATNQDANKVISIAPYFSMLEAEGKVIPKMIGVDFTNRLIAESGLSGVNWSVGYHALAILMENLAKETPKRKGGELLFNKLEATFYGERQQFPNVRSDSQSGSLLVCPKCGEIFPDERALRLRHNLLGWGLYNLSLCQDDLPSDERLEGVQKETVAMWQMLMALSWQVETETHRRRLHWTMQSLSGARLALPSLQHTR